MGTSGFEPVLLGECQAFEQDVHGLESYSDNPARVSDYP